MPGFPTLPPPLKTASKLGRNRKKINLGEILPKHFEKQQGRLVEEMVTLLVAGREEVPIREGKTPARFLWL